MTFLFKYILECRVLHNFIILTFLHFYVFKFLDTFARLPVSEENGIDTTVKY